MKHALSLTFLLCCVGLVAMAQSAAPDTGDSGESAVAVTADSGGPTVGEAATDIVAPGISLVERFRQGGNIMWFLLALSFVMVTFTLERLARLRYGRVIPQGLESRARDAWGRGDFAGVVAAAGQHPSVLGSAVRLLAAHRTLPGSDVSTMAGDEVSRLMRRHLQKAYPLAIVATLSPLLGLLGTVTGMIDAFEVVAIAGSLGDASLLAAGISKALITTAFGLIVAIPALGLYHFFRGRTNELSLEVEEIVDNLLRDWFHARREV